ncbi:MAG: acyl carrier protein [Clostridia bacterium]|nr:acyl carrier protein [Clostridia bacterium]
MFEEVKKLLIKELRLKDVEVTPESRIKEDLHADSLSVLTLIMTIEEEYNIQIPDEELMKFNTVGDVVKFLEGLK